MCKFMTGQNGCKYSRAKRKKNQAKINLYTVLIQSITINNHINIKFEEKQFYDFCGEIFNAQSFSLE